MKWNQKELSPAWYCFLLSLGRLWYREYKRQTSEEDTHYALEEDVVSVEKKETAKPESTKSVEPTKTPKQKTAVSTSTPKEKIKGKTQENRL